MKVSKKTDYALRALFAIAGLKGESISTKNLAEDIDVPRRFLENIMLEMNNAGWVRSIPGRYGGYVLAKNANDITLGEVIRHFEGMLAMISCVSTSCYESCSQESRCYFRRVFLNIRNITAHILDQMSISSCLSEMPITKEDIYQDRYIGGLGI